ncbi:putative lipoprotein [Neisseria weaveri]|uniref:Putative lipoprotein n=2 Tax=Neisseria weaveri TaxID=28091 RepID=A0A3S5F9R1_9NEIS|nr:putative lipoprotein [Neisseria weaveri]VEJ51097.1 putative lipoprotein [Neisseria weaveri]
MALCIIAFLFKILNLATSVQRKPIMKPYVLLLAAVSILGGCGYKGDLYLPKENDKARFGVIQTGLQFESKEPTSQEP